MLKSKMIMNVLLVLTVLFCLLPIDSSIAGICDEQREQTSDQVKNRITPAAPTITGNYNYPSDWTCPENPSLEYDTANSVETIDRNGSAALVVIGNNGPYTWSVSGTGFTLETEGEPTGATNTLYADGSACGAATITVSGCDGTEVTGYVRCTTGKWVQACVFSGEPDDWDGNPAHCCSGFGIGISGASAGHVVYFDPAHMVYSAGCCSAAFVEGPGGDSCATLSAFSCTFPSTGLSKTMYDYVMEKFGWYGYDLQYGCFNYYYSFREWSCP